MRSNSLAGKPILPQICSGSLSCYATGQNNSSSVFSTWSFLQSAVIFICLCEFAVLRGFAAGVWQREQRTEGGREKERAFNLPVDVALHHERQADVGDEIITIIKPSVRFIKQLIWFDIVRWGIIRGLVKQLFSLIKLARSLPAGGKCFSRKCNLSERQESVSC